MLDLEEYRALTQKGNWKGICDVNSVPFDTFGTKKEFRVLSDYLEEQEVVLAITSGVMSQSDTSNSFDFGANTWVIALTNERFLLLDCAMLTGSTDNQSIRLDRV